MPRAGARYRRWQPRGLPSPSSAQVGGCCCGLPTGALPPLHLPRFACRDLHAELHLRLLHCAALCAGEHMHEFEAFETAKFVGRLLGRGDWGGFIDKVKDAIPEVCGRVCVRGGLGGPD